MGGEVTGVCSAAHQDRVRSLGATRVINYKLEGFTASGQHYDLVFDVVCSKSVQHCLNVLNPGGHLIRIQAGLAEMCRAMLLPRRAGRHVIVGTAEERPDHLNHLADFVGQGRCRPVIAHVFPFDEAIEAHRYADRPGHGGSVVIKMKDIRENGMLPIRRREGLSAPTVIDFQTLYKSVCRPPKPATVR